MILTLCKAMICLEIHKPNPEPPNVKVICIGDGFIANLGGKHQLPTSALKFVSIELGEFAKDFVVVLLGNACAVVDDLHQQNILHYRILHTKPRVSSYMTMCIYEIVPIYAH